jgi:uncharacterized protein (TIGR03067 family)
MKRSILGFSVVAVTLAAIATIAFADDAKEAAIKKDRKQIKGTWRIIELIIDGNKSAEEDARKLTVVNGADGTWILRDEDREINRGTSTIDPTKKPKNIDFTVTEGDGKGNQHKGIYDLGKKTRRLCFAPAGKERPTEFSSVPGSGIILVNFERKKAK